MVFAGSALAFELPKVPGITGGASTATSTADAGGMQDSLIKKYVDAARDINTAQTHLANAFGLKDKTTLLEATGKALESGAVDKSSIEKQMSLSNTLSEEIKKKIAGGAQLSDEGKKEYAASLEPLATGVMKVSKLSPDLATFADSAKQQLSSGSLVEKAQITNKLSSGMYLVTNAPSFISNTSSSLKQILNYGQNNKIPLPKEATDILGGL